MLPSEAPQHSSIASVLEEVHQALRTVRDNRLLDLVHLTSDLEQADQRVDAVVVGHAVELLVSFTFACHSLKVLALRVTASMQKRISRWDLSVALPESTANLSAASFSFSSIDAQNLLRSSALAETMSSEAPSDLKAPRQRRTTLPALRACPHGSSRRPTRRHRGRSKTPPSS